MRDLLICFYFSKPLLKRNKTKTIFQRHLPIQKFGLLIIVQVANLFGPKGILEQQNRNIYLSLMKFQIQCLINSLNAMLYQMIEKVNEDRERKAREKNLALMKKIKRLERKKREFSGGEEAYSDGEDSYVEMDEPYNNQQSMIPQQQQQQQFQPQTIQRLSPDFKRKQQKYHQQMAALDHSQSLLFGQNQSDPILSMVDSLPPGTQVPLIPFTSYGGGKPLDDPFRAAEEKVRAIKNNIRIRMGDAPLNSTLDHLDMEQLTLQERVAIKMQQQAQTEGFVNDSQAFSRMHSSVNAVSRPGGMGSREQAFGGAERQSQMMITENNVKSQVASQRGNKSPKSPMAKSVGFIAPSQQQQQQSQRQTGMTGIQQPSSGQNGTNIKFLNVETKPL